MDKIKKIIQSIRDIGFRNIMLAFALSGIISISGGSLVNMYFGANTAETTDISKGEAKEVGYSEFLTLVKDHKISSAKIQSSKVEALGEDGQKYTLNHDRWLFSTTFPKDLAEAGVDVTFPGPEDKSLGEIVSYIVGIIFQITFLALLGLVGFVFLRNATGGMSSWPELAKENTIRFSDIAGQDETKFELEEVKDFLSNPAAYEVTGAKPPRGVLMVGPPGTGKTMLAKALANEAGVNFFAITGSDFSAMFVGVGRNRVVKLFKEARKHAPCIIFIDEIDSVARKRGGGSSDVGREQDTTLNQLLTEMNGFQPRDGIVVIGATNRIDVLDPALTRPGRFDRHIFVNHSDMDGRKAILEVHVKNKPIDADVDLQVVARGTPGFSGADLENLVNEAAILAARAKMKTINASHFEEARDKVLMGLQRKSLVLDDQDVNLIAVHEAGHAVVATLTKGSDPVHQATIIPRGAALGLVMRLPERDRFSVPLSKLYADLDVAMAGRAAEEIVLGKENVTTGASGDIEQATSLAKKMVTEWGMSDVIGMVRAVDINGKPTAAAEPEIRRLIDEAYGRAKSLLETNRDGLDRLVQALLEKKTLDGIEVAEIVTGANSAS